MASQISNQPSHIYKAEILIVDDESDNVDLLYRSFYREFKGLRAENAQLALDILTQHSDTAKIVSDQRMPLMSGTEPSHQVALHKTIPTRFG